jgi:hypothetical protein
MTEINAEAERCISGDGALAAHNVSHARGRDANLFCQPVSGEAERLKKLGEEDFSGMD